MPDWIKEALLSGLSIAIGLLVAGFLVGLLGFGSPEEAGQAARDRSQPRRV